MPDATTPSQAEAAARDMGWRPLAEFRGDPAKWVDADVFVSRGEHFLPILRANNKRLQDQVSEQNAALEETRTLLAASQESIKELKKFHDEDTVRQVAKARRDLVAEIKQAREDGDVDKELTLQGEVTRLDAAVANAPAAAPASAPTTPPKPAAQDPEFLAWESENPWFKTDARRHALAMAIATEIRRDPSNNKLVGRAFYDRIGEEVEAYLAPAGATSKVGTSRSGGGNAPAPSPAARKFSDLPSDAQDACALYAKKLVGPGRAYKDLDSWRAEYTRKYFEGEES
jgi:hypothetical protein